MLRRRNCLHTYVVTGYHNYVDFSSSIVESYEITCEDCRSSIVVSLKEYDHMKDIGLIKERKDI